MAIGKIIIEENRCKGCELCIHVCPQKILQLSSKINKKGFHPIEVTDEKKCTGCSLCYTICPDIVISVYREEKTSKEEGR